MFFIIEKSEETTFNFFTKFCHNYINNRKKKIINLLNDSDNENSEFATKKWYIIDN